MAFFKSIFQKQRVEKHQSENSVPYNCYQEIMLQYQHKHIVYKLQEGVITYRNTISPRDAGGRFPEGYFDVKTVMLPKKAQKEIRNLIGTAVSQLSFVDTLDLLPPGASREALMKCTKNTGAHTYYSNCHLSESGFSVQRDPVSSIFLDLFKALSSFCEFVPLFDYTAFK